MSAEQQRCDILVFGYVKTTYKGIVPIQLIKVIRLFYDEHFYWIFKNKTLETLKNCNRSEQIICPKLFKIKGFEFEVSLYANGTEQSNDLVLIAIKTKHLPNDVKFVEVYREIKCETSNSVIGKVKKYSKIKNPSVLFRKIICQLSDLKDLKLICFDCFMDIKYIKYKTEFNKIDYCVPINKMHKYFTFQWNINGLLMEKCKKMICKQSVYSENFDNNNWCLILYPNGRFSTFSGQTSIYLCCLSLPFSIRKMTTKFKFCIDESYVAERQKRWTRTRKMKGIDAAIPYTEFKKKKSVTITVTIEILTFTDIYDKQFDEIDENEKEWEKHGIIPNTKTA